MSLKVDFDSLYTSLSHRRYKLSEVQDRIEKVAFDVVKFKGASNNELWQIQSADDGEYIVALYDEEEEQAKTATASIQSNWKVVVKNSELNIFYKHEFMSKFAASQFGFSNQDLETVKTYLPNVLSSNKDLTKSLLNSIDSDTKSYFINKYPELS